MEVREWGNVYYAQHCWVERTLRTIHSARNLRVKLRTLYPTATSREIETSIQEDHVNQTIGDIDRCNFSPDSAGVAWCLVNELTDRKPRSNDVIRGYKSKNQRYQAWVISIDDLQVNNPMLICTDNFTKKSLTKP